MATVVGYDDSNARLFAQFMNMGLQHDQKRRDREFEQARLKYLIGDDQQAEQLFAQSQRSPLRNLFASKTPERVHTSAFADLNPEDKPLLDVPKLNAQQEILAELKSLSGGDEDYYNKNIQAIAADMTNKGIDEQGIGSSAGRRGHQPMWNDAAALFGHNLQGIRGNEQAVQRQAQVQSQNEAIKKANANKPYKAELTGNEMDRINDETENAYRAIQNAATYDDKLKQYGKYVNSVASLRKSYLGDFRPLSMDQMGINPPASGGKGPKPQPAHIVMIDDKGNRRFLTSVNTTALDQKDPAGFAFKNHPDVMKRYGIKDPSQIQLVPAGKEDSNTLGRDVKTSGDIFEQDLIESAVTDQTVKKNTGIIDTAKDMWSNKSLNKSEAERRVFNNNLDKAGDTFSNRVHPVTGKMISYRQYAALGKNSAVDEFLK
jgi:hypothetical protein